MEGYLKTVYDENVRPLTTYPSELAKHLAQRFNFKSHAKMLDVGCGRADFLKGFKDIGFDICGIDKYPEGAKFSGGAHIAKADVEIDAFPFKDDTFDIVFSKSVLEHLNDADHFMKECYRVLKPGGRIIIMTPDWVSTMKVFYDDPTHRQPFTVEGVLSILQMNEFKNISVELFYQLPVLWRWPALKFISKVLQLFVGAHHRPKNKFVRWSVELMVLGTGIK